MRKPKKPKLSEAELEKKRWAVRQALASMRLEGFVFTEEELAVYEKIANGEMTTEEARNKCLQELEQLRKERPELFYHGE